MLPPIKPPAVTFSVDAVNLVFVGPYLAAKNSYTVHPSALEPGKVRIVFKGDAIPEDFVAFIEAGAVRAILPAPNGLPVEFGVNEATITGTAAPEGPSLTLVQDPS